jgi:hypothetical protein
VARFCKAAIFVPYSCAFAPESRACKIARWRQGAAPSPEWAAWIEEGGQSAFRWPEIVLPCGEAVPPGPGLHTDIGLRGGAMTLLQRNNKHCHY